MNLSNGIMKNKKIKNATPNSLKGINFKSKLEMKVYEALLKEGIRPLYEGITYILSNGVRPSVGFYEKTKKRGFHYEMQPLKPITYTPDFTFKYNKVQVIIEVKGIANDVYPLKKNLFRKKLECLPERILFFEVKSVKDLKECIEIIKMETPLMTKIRQGIPHLPEKDISIANKYLEERNFDNLLELIDSSIRRVNKNKVKYADIEVAYLHKLREAVYEYNEARFI